MKTMIYVTEDGQRFGYKPAKFNFAIGTKLMDKGTGKMFICFGVFDIPECRMAELKYHFKYLAHLEQGAPIEYQAQLAAEPLENRAKSLAKFASKLK